jgi:hypothetical protein
LAACWKYGKCPLASSELPQGEVEKLQKSGFYATASLIEKLLEEVGET